MMVFNKIGLDKRKLFNFRLKSIACNFAIQKYKNINKTTSETYYSIHNYIRQVIKQTICNLKSMLLEQCTKYFCQKCKILIRTVYNFSIDIISEFVLLANRCVTLN